MAIHRTEAFVLKTQPLRSSSLIVTFFTPGFGKMKGVAKGVRREKELRGALYELFTRLEIVFYEKTRSDLHLISDAAIVDSNDGLRRRFDTITYASYFCEMVDVLTVVHDRHEPVFDLLDFVFRYLRSIPGSQLTLVFKLKLLNEVGWLPYLAGCFHCRKVQFEEGFFSVSQGALLCPACGRNYTDARSISGEALGALRYYGNHQPEDCIRRRLTPSVEGELTVWLSEFLDFRLPIPLKTTQFIEAVRPVLSDLA
ncbi:MAG: DNA repair protein RecO [Candidatus Omnitrophota bacterium]|nr:DNA repair protein RecO [Candidatus Omnitrophota bacterium]